jgi:hypothetical protein
MVSKFAASHFNLHRYVACKIATVVINCLIWDKHASFEGLVALFVCLFSGMAYQQAPMRIQK